MEKFNPDLLEECLTIEVKVKPFDGVNSCLVELTGTSGTHVFSTRYKYYNLPSDMSIVRALVAWTRMLKPFIRREEITVVSDQPSLVWLLTGVRGSKHNGEKRAMITLRGLLRELKERGVVIRVELSECVFDTKDLDIRIDPKLEEIIRGK